MMMFAVSTPHQRHAFDAESGEVLTSANGVVSNGSRDGATWRESAFLQNLSQLLSQHERDRLGKEYRVNGGTPVLYRSCVFVHQDI